MTINLNEPITNLNEPTVKLSANELAEILKENPDFITSLQNRIEEQEKEIERLKLKLSVEKSRLNLNIQAVSKIKEQAKEIEQLKATIQAFRAGHGSKSSFAFGFEAPVCLEQYKSNQCMASDLNDAFVYMKGKING